MARMLEKRKSGNRPMVNGNWEFGQCRQGSALWKTGIECGGGKQRRRAMRTYRTLALVGTFIKIIGWLTVILTVLSACGLLALGIAGSLALPGLTGVNIPVGG